MVKVSYMSFTTVKSCANPSFYFLKPWRTHHTFLMHRTHRNINALTECFMRNSCNLKTSSKNWLVSLNTLYALVLCVKSKAVNSCVNQFSCRDTNLEQFSLDELSCFKLKDLLERVSMNTFCAIKSIHTLRTSTQEWRAGASFTFAFLSQEKPWSAFCTNNIKVVVHFVMFVHTILDLISTSLSF